MRSEPSKCLVYCPETVQLQQNSPRLALGVCCKPGCDVSTTVTAAVGELACRSLSIASATSSGLDVLLALCFNLLREGDLEPVRGAAMGSPTVDVFFEDTVVCATPGIVW